MPVKSSAPAEEKFLCDLNCYKCGESCADIVRGGADYSVKASYKCFNLMQDATFGAKDCQFPLISKDKSLGLKCDRCRVSSVPTFKNLRIKLGNLIYSRYNYKVG
jgi:hypothetical protein